MFPSGYVVYKYKELDGTNSEALRLLNRKAIRDKSVIIAEKQTKGKGRSNKTWISPLGNIYMTLVIRSAINIGSLTQYCFLAAVAVGETLQNIEYKWPNDILLDGKKICGILLEHHNDGYVIIGIGVNVVEAPDYATYIDKYYDVDSWDLSADIVKSFNCEEKQWLSFGFSEIRKKWLSKAWNLNNMLTAKIGKEIIKGKFIDIDLDGKLILENQNKIYKLSSGEVFL
ncbi:MAG: biotin--[acetyl-CoA-carboxylase] ligase [Rickettsiaceae bacterium H1]|nr:biotin--[acetyl-CoA-carboxylase] ligase [Rickettsiaceae bacterium H1]